MAFDRYGQRFFDGEWAEHEPEAALRAERRILAEMKSAEIGRVPSDPPWKKHLAAQGKETYFPEQIPPPK